MLVERVPLVVKDPVERGQFGLVGIEPGVHALVLDLDDGPVASVGGRLRLGILSDGSELHQIRLLAGRIRRT